MTVKKTTKEKQESKIESMEDEIQRLKTNNTLKIIFGILGFLTLSVATGFGVKTSPTDFKGFVFESNALHLLAAIFICLPWASSIFKRR